MKFNIEEYNKLLSDVHKLEHEEEMLVRNLARMLVANNEAYDIFFELRHLQIDIRAARREAENYLRYSSKD